MRANVCTRSEARDSSSRWDARVQMHMESTGDVNLDAAVADLVALMKA